MDSLVDGQAYRVNLSETPHFTIQADAVGSVVDQVIFEVDGVQERVDLVPPFLIAGNRRSKILPWTKAPYGTHLITAVPYAGGVKGVPFTFLLNVSGRPPSTVNRFVPGNVAPVVQLYLFDARDQVDLQLMSPVVPTVVDRRQYSRFSVRAEAVGNSTMGTALFYDNGRFVRRDEEEPYTATGEREGAIRGWRLDPGTHTITVKSYSGRRASGLEGEVLNVQLTVI